jgi:hypothetical protein
VAVEPEELVEALREENEALLVRIAHLEATCDEYRRQMVGLLTSSSWRATAPLRSAAGLGRLARRRIRRLPELASRNPAPEGGAFTTALRRRPCAGRFDEALEALRR